MKSIEQKRTEALARRIKDVEFWQKALKVAKFESQVDRAAHKIKAAQRDIANLIKKLGRSV